MGGFRLFPVFRCELEHQFSLGLAPAGPQVNTTPSALLVLRPLDSAWNDTISSPGSSVCCLPLQILGLSSLCNHVSQSLIRMVPFLWRTLTDPQNLLAFLLLRYVLLGQLLFGPISTCQSVLGLVLGSPLLFSA